MADGGGRPWKDEMGPQARLCIFQRMVTKLAQVLKADQQQVDLEKLRSVAASAEEDAFSKAQSQADYMRRISFAMHRLISNGQRPLQAAAAGNRKQQMPTAQQMQLGNPDEAIQGGNSVFTTSARAAPVMAGTVWPPAHQPNQHVAGPNTQMRPCNMMSMANQNFQPQSAASAPVVWGFQPGQQVVHSVPMQSQNKRQAVQLQYPSFASCNPATVQAANHLLQQNANGISRLQQQPTHSMRNQHGLGVNQHHTNSQWYQMVGANNWAEMNTGYPGGLNCQQDVGCAAGLQSTLESELVTPGRYYGQVTTNQQGNVYCSGPQTSGMTIRDEAVDWREEIFRQIELWKAAYLSELMELNRIVIIPKITEEQLQSFPMDKAAAYTKSSTFKSSIIRVLGFLHLQKGEISETHRLELPKYQAAIQQMLDCGRKLRARKGQGLQEDRHGKAQTINLTGQQHQQEQPANASISQARQNVVTTTPPPANISRGERDPFLAAKPSAGLRTSSPETDAVACCTASPAVSQPAGAVVAAVSPCASGKSSLTSTAAADEPVIVAAAASPCLDVVDSAVGKTGTPASEAKDDEAAVGKAATPVAKKPIERLLDAVRAASPAVLRSSVNSIKWALLEMDSVPHAPWSGFGSSSRMKRVFDVISSYSDEECPPTAVVGTGSDGAAAKRQKAQVLPGPVTD